MGSNPITRSISFILVSCGGVLSLFLRGYRTKITRNFLLVLRSILNNHFCYIYHSKIFSKIQRYLYDSHLARLKSYLYDRHLSTSVLTHFLLISFLITFIDLCDKNRKPESSDFDCAPARAVQSLS